MHRECPVSRCPPQARGQSGMTLVELAVSSVLLATALSLVAEITFSFSSALSTISAQGLLQIQLTQGTDAFNRDAHLATALPLTQGAYTQDLDSTVDGTATLILQVPAIDGTGTVIPARFDFIIYTFDNAAFPGQLRRIVEADDGPPPSVRATATEPDSTRVEANSISRVTVALANVNGTPPPLNEITMTLVGSRTERGRAHTLTLASRSVIRN